TSLMHCMNLKRFAITLCSLLTCLSLGCTCPDPAVQDAVNEFIDPDVPLDQAAANLQGAIDNAFNEAADTDAALRVLSASFEQELDTPEEMQAFHSRSNDLIGFITEPQLTRAYSERAAARNGTLSHRIRRLLPGSLQG